MHGVEANIDPLRLQVWVWPQSAAQSLSSPSLHLLIVLAECAMHLFVRVHRPPGWATQRFQARHLFCKTCPECEGRWHNMCQTRALNQPTFGIAPLTFAPQPCLTINYTCKRITNWQNETISSKSGRETLKRRPTRKKRSSASSTTPIHLRLRWRRSKSL